MAPTIRLDSYASLQSLHHASQKGAQGASDLALPDRSRLDPTEPIAFLDTAIGFVAKHTGNLYEKQDSTFVEIVAVKHGVAKIDRQVNRFESGVKGALTSLAGRLDGVEQRLDGVEGRLDGVEQRLNSVEQRLSGVEENLGELRSQVKNVESQVKNVESQVKNVESQVKNLQQDLHTHTKSVERILRNTAAIQLNSLRKYLQDPIQPIFTLGPGGASEVPEQFPEFVYQFWALLADPTALTHLAKHYDLVGWERWQRSTSHDTEGTDFLSLEDAVAACPERCLRALAGAWGLHYHLLQEPGSQTKRKADSEDSTPSRRRRRVEFDERVESVISRDERGEFTRQDRNIRIGPRQPLRDDEISFTEVVQRYPNPPGHFRVSFESAHITWLPRPSPPSPNRSPEATESIHS